MYTLRIMFLIAAPCIDKSQGGPRITRENRAIDWRILITGHPTPEVSWGKNDNSIDDHRVIIRNETDFEGLIACLSVAKCKVLHKYYIYKFDLKRKNTKFFLIRQLCCAPALLPFNFQN